MAKINLNHLLAQADLPEGILEEEGSYIKAVREGISGAILQPTISKLGLRDLFSLLLNTDKSNLSKFYRQERLSPTVSEAILDTLRVFELAFKVYEGDTDSAIKWLHTQIPALSGQIPMDLLDTFRGRKLVTDCLIVMEYGDFT